MAKIMLPGMGSVALAKIDERVECIVTRNLTADQVAAGVVAKIQIRHPAASFIATVWSKNGRKWVSEPAQEGKNKWFPLVALTKEVKDYILNLVNSEAVDNSAWYLEMIGAHTTNITAEASNPDLGIESIAVDNNLTDRQAGKGMICKVNIETTIGSFYGYTIWNSKFGASLYGTAPSEGTTDEGSRGAPGYRLSREAVAQVLSYLHNMVDFDAIVTVPEGTFDPKVEEVMQAEGFEPVGDAMFEADKAEA